MFHKDTKKMEETLDYGSHVSGVTRRLENCCRPERIDFYLPELNLEIEFEHFPSLSAHVFRGLWKIDYCMACGVVVGAGWFSSCIFPCSILWDIVDTLSERSGSRTRARSFVRSFVRCDSHGWCYRGIASFDRIRVRSSNIRPHKALVFWAFRRSWRISDRSITVFATAIASGESQSFRLH